MRKFQPNEFLNIFEFFGIVCVSISDALYRQCCHSCFFSIINKQLIHYQDNFKLVATKIFCPWKYFHNSHAQTMYSVVILDFDNIVNFVLLEEAAQRCS